MLFVVVSSLMASYSRFPEDPPDVDVIDRAFFRGVVDGEEYVVYIIMYDQDNRGILDVVSGTLSSGSYLWETVFSWKPYDILSEPVRFDPRSVIHMQLSGSSLIITWLDRLSSAYVEGAASQYLEYDLPSGNAEEFWSD
jgi:hypothetical protein